MKQKAHMLIDCHRCVTWQSQGTFMFLSKSHLYPAAYHGHAWRPCFAVYRTIPTKNVFSKHASAPSLDSSYAHVLPMWQVLWQPGAAAADGVHTPGSCMHVSTCHGGGGAACLRGGRARDRRSACMLHALTDPLDYAASQFASSQCALLMKKSR